MDEHESVVDDNPLQKFLAELRARREALDGADWTAPEPPPDEFQFGDYRLKPLTMSSLAPLPDPISLDHLRAVMPIRIHQYLDSDTESALLVKAPPGAGKTHSLIDIAQFYAGRGWRTLWCAGRHSMFEEIQNFANFNPALWYHWQGIQRQIDGEAACRYAASQRHWSELGYEAIHLCRQLCGHHQDNWIVQCPFRVQAKRKEPIVFAQHQHLVSGLPVSDFDLVIVDELPLGAFVSERIIPADGLTLAASGPVASLVERLAHLCHSAPASRRLAGKALFDEIGAILDDVYAQVDEGLGLLPETPQVYHPGDVARQPYWYLMQFLELAAAEHRAWQAGWPEWNEFVWCTRRGLHLLSRAKPWEKLPPRMIVLDATAEPELYRTLLGRPVESYAPTVERKGKLYQITGRLNGKHSTMRRGQLTNAGAEMLAIAKRLTRNAKYPAFICWKTHAPYFRREFGADRVMTFGGLRGANELGDADVLVIAGTYTPDGSAMIDQAAALSGQIKPFFNLDEHGKRIPLYRYADREYRLSQAGLACVQAQFGQANRAVARRTGYYANPILDSIHRQLREAELTQALHRARLNVREAVVWLITATPLPDEPLDGVWDDPPIAPEGIHWQTWLGLEPWLDTAQKTGVIVTYETVAEAAGVKADWPRKKNWLRQIAAYLPHLWQAGPLPAEGRGRPAIGLFPIPPIFEDSS